MKEKTRIKKVVPPEYAHLTEGALKAMRLWDTFEDAVAETPAKAEPVKRAKGSEPAEG